jgi:hypothetical protein
MPVFLIKGNETSYEDDGMLSNRWNLLKMLGVMFVVTCWFTLGALLANTLSASGFGLVQVCGGIG